MTRGRLLALPVLAALAALLPAVASAAPTAIDLSTYVPAGRFNLPTSADVTDQLSQEASAVTYDWDTDTLFLVGDEGTSVVQVSKTGALINSMKLTGFEDTEGLTYVGGGKFVLTEERLRKVDRFTYAAGTTLARDRGSVDQVKLGTTVGNIGLEGVTNDPQTGGLVVVKEKDPRGVFATVPNWGAGIASVGSPATDNPPNLFNPDALGLLDLSDVYALSNVAGLAGHPDAGHLLIISQESGKVVNVDRGGTVSSTLTIRRPAGAALTVPDMTMEGVTADADGKVYVVNEQGGGVGVPQLWVYQHTDTPNAGPTAVALSPVLTSIPENANTSAPTKVADVSVTDDDLGVNTLGLTGPDASSFSVDDTGLYLKAGVALIHTGKPSYQVSVTVDDPSTGGTPDAASSGYTLTVTAASGGGPTTSAIKVTEVAPWGSSNGTYNADWFELTNTGTTTVDLTGWRMDDDSNAFGNAVVLNGVGSLAPGASAIFLEGDSDTRTEWGTAWFPGGSAPAVGYYEGSGVGLSTGGDQVNIFDSLGNRITGVAFGAATAGRTFDNAAGADAVTLLSSAGLGGAFTTGGGETGSPGRAPAPLKVTEVAPWGSSDATYGADWWELTNTASYAVDLTGWKMDDSSDAFASAVALSGVTTLAPGASAVFLEGDASKVTAFKSVWFGAAVPAGLQVGTYSGSGVGLSGSGDAVNVYDPSGAKVFGVSFGAQTDKVTFDNAAGGATVSTLSVVGANGAFASAANGETGSPGRIAVPAPPSVKVTEVAPWGSGSAYAADWWELTNTGDTTVDLTGWKMDDASNASASAVALSGVTSLAPGASAIFVEGGATEIAAFKTAWFGSDLPAGLQVGFYTGSGVGLATGGDAVNLFNALGDRVTGVSFGAATNKVSFDNKAGDATVSTLSVAGINGAFTSGAGEVGSPGTVVQLPPLASAKVTEVSPWSSGDSSYAADWFELTNAGDSAIDMTGWKMDDSSNAYGTAVALHGVPSLAPGASALFVEGDADTAADLVDSWFGGDAPAGVQVGSYSGSGVGLGTSGDAVNVFDAAGRRVTGVTFGAATSGRTFDNAAGAASVATLSTVGVNGAFRSGEGEVGSPGTIARDTTPPVVTYSGNLGTYTTGMAVHITCTAVDERFGSGVVSTTCAPIEGLGATFGVGPQAFTATATDAAGNTGTATVRFTVTPMPMPMPGTSAPAPPPAATPPAAGSSPSSSPAAPAGGPPAVTPANPAVDAPDSVNARQLTKGVVTRLEHLAPTSKIRVEIRLGGGRLKTLTATANADGAGRVRLKLSRRQLARVRGRTVTVRYTVVGADGRERTLTQRIPVT